MSDNDELEVGHDLDRALRASVTGLAQLMERNARGRADNDRAAAAQLREQWLRDRDAARKEFTPWTRRGAVEDASAGPASRAWAVAAAWSDLDPLARSAEKNLAHRIRETHGDHPSNLINKPDPTPRQPSPETLTMAEAVELAREHAPFYYREHERIEATGAGPSSDAERRFLDHWQHYAEHGELPERTRWEAWAAASGNGDDFTDDKWRTADGQVDHDARDSALVRVWDEGAEERGIRELEEHQVAMAAAGLPDLGSQVTPPAKPTWVSLTTDPQALDQATPEEVARAWRDARAAGAHGDLAAQAAAAHIGERIRATHGVDPDTYLLDAMTDRAALNAEQRRAAEDLARRKGEEAAQAAPVATGAGAPAVPGAGEITRARAVELNTEAAEYFAAQMRPGTEGHRYLVDRLGEDAMAGPWAVGYARPGWTNLRDHLRQHGATDQEIVAAGLGTVSSRGNVIDSFRDRVTVGIRNADGEIVGFTARDLSGDERAPKWINSASTPAFQKSAEVFGLTEAPEGARLIRTEAAFDAMAVTLAGLAGAGDDQAEEQVVGVAAMGTALSDTQAELIAGRSDGRVWVANDSDVAGRKATEQDFYAFARHGADARQVIIPGGGDPAQAWRDRPDLLCTELSMLDSAPSAGEAAIDNYRADTATAGPTTAGLDDVAAKVTGSMTDPLERQLLLERVEQIKADMQAEAYDLHTDARGLEDAAADRNQAAAAAAAADDPEKAEGLATDADRLLSRADVDDHAGDRLEDTAAGTRAADPAPYDRANEANLDGLDQPARTARVDSGHGFSQSTADSLADARTGKRGVAAKRARPGGAAKSRTRRLGGN